MKVLQKYYGQGIYFGDRVKSVIISIITSLPHLKGFRFYKFVYSLIPKTISVKLKIFKQQIKVDTKLNSLDLIILREFILEDAYNLNLVNFKPKKILDIGAYVGYFALKAKANFESSKIVCYEPFIKNFVRLKENIGQLKIETMNCAVSNKNGSIGLSLFSDMAFPSDQEEPNFFIQSINFLDLVQETDSLLIKMDIEGGELDIFPEMIKFLPNTCGIFLETHHGLAEFYNLAKVFEANNFNFKILRERDNFIDSYFERII